MVVHSKLDRNNPPQTMVIAQELKRCFCSSSEKHQSGKCISNKLFLMKPDSLKVLWFYFSKTFRPCKIKCIDNEYTFTHFSHGICAKFLKLRCNRFKSYLFDNQSLTFCSFYSRSCKISKRKTMNAFLKRQLWIELARKLKFFILFIISKALEKSAIVNLPFHILKLLDKNLHYFKFFKHKKTDRILQNCGLFEIFCCSLTFFNAYLHSRNRTSAADFCGKATWI